MTSWPKPPNTNWKAKGSAAGSKASKILTGELKRVQRAQVKYTRDQNMFHKSAARAKGIKFKLGGFGLLGPWGAILLLLALFAATDDNNG